MINKVRETNKEVLSLKESMDKNPADTLYKFVSREIKDFIASLGLTKIVEEMQLSEDIELEKFIILSQVKEAAGIGGNRSVKEQIVNTLELARKITRQNIERFLVENVGDSLIIEVAHKNIGNICLAILV